MFKIFALTYLFFALGQMQESPVDDQGGLIMLPCNKDNRRSGGDILQKPMASYKSEYKQTLPKYTDNINSYAERNTDSKPNMAKIDCRSKRYKNIKAEDLLQNKVNTIKEAAKNVGKQTEVHANDEENLRMHQPKKLKCAITDNSQSSDTRRFMSNDVPAANERPNKDSSRHQQNFNTRSDFIRRLLPTTIFGKGLVPSFNTNYNKDENNDYPSSLGNEYQHAESSNIEKTKYHAATKQDVYAQDKLGNTNPTIIETNKSKSEVMNKESKNSVTLPDRYAETEIAKRQMNNELSGRKLNAISNQLIQPIRGVVISDMNNWKLDSIENQRICYACSSTNDINCWQPNRQTTVRYCRRNYETCVTKTYKNREQDFIVIRDCSDTCDVTLPPDDFEDVKGMKYASCSVCKHDLCNDHYVGNSAVSFSSHSVFVMIIIVGFSKTVL